MNLQRLTRRLVQLRQVADHIDRHLDEDLHLGQLAEIAHMSRFHFERSFADYSGETPLARVRRLRLEKARQRIASGGVSSLLDLALESGYTSAEAFSRAFRVRFGCAPSQLPRSQPSPSPIHITRLPALAVQYLPFHGAVEDAMQVFDELRARALVQNIPRERRKGWSIESATRADGNQIELKAALMSERLGTNISGLAHDSLPAGEYAVIALTGSYTMPSRDAIATRILQETGYALGDGPVLRNFHNATYLPAEQERRCDLYLPVHRA